MMKLKFRKIRRLVHNLMTNSRYVNKNQNPWGFPGSPTSPSTAGCAGLILGWATKIPHALWPKKTKQSRCNIVTHSIKTLKMVHIKKKKKRKPSNQSMPVGRHSNIQCRIPKNPRYADIIIHYFACQIPRRIFVIS